MATERLRSSTLELEAPPEISHQLVDPDQLYDLQAEAALLGAILIDGVQLNECDHLNATAFHDRRHAAIWKAFRDLDAEGQAIEYLTVCDALTRAGQLETAGGEAYLTALLTAPTSSQNAASYKRIVANYAAHRRDYYQHVEAARRDLDMSLPLPADVSLETPRKTRWSIEELLATEFPDPSGPVPGLIPVGLTVLGGRPKRGKSWLMLQLSYSLATGGKFLDHDLKINKVLYYALEDSPRRLKDRLEKFSPTPEALIEFERELKPLHLGGLEQIEVAADDHYLIVIDTLGRAMPGQDFTKDGALFADVMGQLQAIAQAKAISIVAIAHTRKPTGLEHDAVDDVLGSTQGMTASPDCVLAIYREPGKVGSRLQGRSRDSDDVDLTIEFDHDTCAWQLVGSTDQVRKTEAEEQILEALQELGKARVSAIVKATRQDQGNTSRRCAELWTRGLIKKEIVNGVNHYYLPTMGT